MNQAVNTPKKLEALINDTAQGARNINHTAIDESVKQALLTEIKKLLIEQDAVLVAHYYVDDELQDLADATGGTGRRQRLRAFPVPAVGCSRRGRRWPSCGVGHAGRCVG